MNRIKLGVFAANETSGGGNKLGSIAEHYQKLAMKIKAVIWQEDGVWCASVPALPGCHTWGENYEHLLEMLKDAIQGWLEVASEQKEIEPEKQLTSYEY